MKKPRQPVKKAAAEVAPDRSGPTGRRAVDRLDRRRGRHCGGPVPPLGVQGPRRRPVARRGQQRQRGLHADARRSLDEHRVRFVSHVLDPDPPGLVRDGAGQRRGPEGPGPADGAPDPRHALAGLSPHGVKGPAAVPGDLRDEPGGDPAGRFRSRLRAGRDPDRAGDGPSLGDDGVPQPPPDRRCDDRIGAEHPDPLLQHGPPGGHRRGRGSGSSSPAPVEAGRAAGGDRTGFRPYAPAQLVHPQPDEPVEHHREARPHSGGVPQGGTGDPGLGGEFHDVGLAGPGCGRAWWRPAWRSLAGFARDSRTRRETGPCTWAPPCWWARCCTSPSSSCCAGIPTPGHFYAWMAFAALWRRRAHRGPAPRRGVGRFPRRLRSRPRGGDFRPGAAGSAGPDDEHGPACLGAERR